MRGLGGLSLVLLVLVGGLVWAVVWGPLRDVSLVRRQSSNSVQPTAPLPEQATKSPSSAKVRRTPDSPKESGRGATAEAAAVTPVQEVAAAASSQAPTQYKFPTAVDVPLGTFGSAVVDAFGPPAARTLAVDESGRVEIFIYRRSRPDTATVINVRNGRVISAVTTAY